MEEIALTTSPPELPATILQHTNIEQPDNFTVSEWDCDINPHPHRANVGSGLSTIVDKY